VVLSAGALFCTVVGFCVLAHPVNAAPVITTAWKSFAGANLIAARVPEPAARHNQNVVGDVADIPGNRARIAAGNAFVREGLIYTLDAGEAGYVRFYKLGNAGHVRDLVVAPGARDGIGEQLMTASAKALRDAGAAEWHGSVAANDVTAIDLYEKLGMRAEHRSTVVRLAWSTIGALPAELAAVQPVSPEEDDDIERALDLESGRIAMARRERARVLLQLRDRELAPIGFAAFDPAARCAMPFRVARPSLAAVLLASLRKHARHDDAQIVVENHDALAEALVAAGAAVRLRLLHFTGALSSAATRCA
jgi:hypothetical protein